MADMVSEKALVREREGKSIPSMRELVEQAAVNPEVFEKIGPERTIQMMFFVGDYSKFNVFVQKSE
jgi:DNA-binding transcriptional regulator YhcF (GntR family)